MEIEIWDQSSCLTRHFGQYYYTSKIVFISHIAYEIEGAMN